MRENVTCGEVVRGMREVVEEAGSDYRYGDGRIPGYASCVYVVAGEPSCAVGRLLISKLGVPVSFFASRCTHGSLRDMRRNEVDIGALLTETNLQEHIAFAVEDEENIRRFLTVFQQNQDNNLSWGECLTRALDAVR